MHPRRLLLPAAFGLSLFGLGASAYAMLWPIMDVRVVNRSGATLRNLRVCVHECVTRAELREGRTWRVPLQVRQDGGATLIYEGLSDEQNANTYITPGLGVHWVVRADGRIEQKQ
ncbi:hypothetical protein V3W47_04955 [Deinococcus sp. YIM 134068]|uniref:hypothetical protein n=1 Tax=Deinococcus lichenicola TaxID=3118910 RepID=UPI002F944AA7